MHQILYVPARHGSDTDDTGDPAVPQWSMAERPAPATCLCLWRNPNSNAAAQNLEVSTVDLGFCISFFRNLPIGKPRGKAPGKWSRISGFSTSSCMFTRWMHYFFSEILVQTMMIHHWIFGVNIQFLDPTTLEHDWHLGMQHDSDPGQLVDSKKLWKMGKKKRDTHRSTTDLDHWISSNKEFIPGNLH